MICLIQQVNGVGMKYHRILVNHCDRPWNLYYLSKNPRVGDIADLIHMIEEYFYSKDYLKGRQGHYTP